MNDKELAEINTLYDNLCAEDKEDFLNFLRAKMEKEGARK